MKRHIIPALKFLTELNRAEVEAYLFETTPARLNINDGLTGQQAFQKIKPASIADKRCAARRAVARQGWQDWLCLGAQNRAPED
jgi:hypothetical protein